MRMITFLALATFLVTPALADLRSDLLTVVKKNNIVFYGENHELREARRILIDTLAEGFESGVLDAFATEYVLEEIESDFQNYLTDSGAVVGSRAESKFFKKIEDTGYVWLKEDLNKDFFRFLRLAKQKNPGLRICGLDVRGSSEKQERTKRFQLMTPVLRKKAETSFRLSVHEMIEATDQNYDREPMMARRTLDCVKGSNHALVHIGAYHAFSLRYNLSKYETEEEKKEAGWLAVTGFVHELEPNAKIVTVLTAQAVRAHDQDLEGLNNNFSKASTHLRLVSPRLYSSDDLVNRIGSVLTVTQDSGVTVPMTDVWDYFILGPEGTYAPLWAQ